MAFQVAQTEAEEDAALDPSVVAPAEGRGGVGRGGAEGAGFEGVPEGVEGGEGFGVADGGGTLREVVFDGGLEGDQFCGGHWR